MSSFLSLILTSVTMVYRNILSVKSSKNPRVCWLKLHVWTTAPCLGSLVSMGENLFLVQLLPSISKIHHQNRILAAQLPMFLPDLNCSVLQYLNRLVQHSPVTEIWPKWWHPWFSGKPETSFCCVYPMYGCFWHAANTAPLEGLPILRCAI